MLRRLRGFKGGLWCLKKFIMHILLTTMRYSVLLCSLADFLTNAYGLTDRETFANLKLLSELKNAPMNFPII